MDNNRETASSKFYRMASKLKIIENNVSKIEQACGPYADRLEGYGETFQQEFDEIKLGLRFLSGDLLDVEQRKILSRGGPIEFLSSTLPNDDNLNDDNLNDDDLNDDNFQDFTSHKYVPEYEPWNFERDYIDPTLQWTRYYLDKCRNYTRGISNLQQKFLERRYAPGGSLSQKAQQSFYLTSMKQNN